jgi:hypothetical protein
MRAFEFITEQGVRTPTQSLRHLNKLKGMAREREASHAKHLELVRFMYANPEIESRQIDLEKSRLELEQLKVEIAATKSETKTEAISAIFDQAKSIQTNRQKKSEHISSMAESAMIDRRKRSTS